MLGVEIVLARIRLSLTPLLVALSRPMPRRGALLYALLVFLAGASLIREASVGRLAPVDERWSDILARRASPKSATAPVTLVEISDETLIKHAWPWGPDDFALFFHAALPFQPAVLALGEILDFERDLLAERDPVFEKMLRDHVLRSPKLVLAGRLGWAPDADTAPDLRPMPVLRKDKVRGDLRQVPEFSDVSAWAAEDYRLTTQPGWTNLPDTAGPRARCPLVLRYRGQPVPSIVLQLAMHLEKVTLDEVEVVLGSHIAIGKSRTVPIDEAGRMLVNPGATYGRIAFDDLLLSREQIDRKETPVQPVDFFKGRVILLSRSDTEARLLTSPDGQKIAPGEFFAASLATLEANAFPRRIGTWFDWSLVGFAAINALWLRKWKPLFSVSAVALILAGYAGIAFLIFNSRFLILPIALPAGLAVWVLLLRLVARRIERVIAF